MPSSAILIVVPCEMICPLLLHVTVRSTYTFNGVVLWKIIITTRSRLREGNIGCNTGSSDEIRTIQMLDGKLETNKGITECDGDIGEQVVSVASEATVFLQHQ